MLNMILHAGLPALFISLILENIGLPTPGESILITMGAAAGDGKYAFIAVLAVGWVAAVIGGSLSYFIGAKLGRPMILHYGSKVGLGESQYEYAEKMMIKYGFFLVVAARFFIVLRQLNGVIAGATEMHWASYTAANILGATLWVGFWVTLADYFGHDLHRILPYFYHHLSLLAMLLVILLIVAWGIYRWRTNKKK